MQDVITAALAEAQESLFNLQQDKQALYHIEQASVLLANTFRSGKRAFSCGNGGSMSDAMHFAEELTGRFRLDRKGLPATAISDAGHITCAGNDFGYERIFSRYIESHGQEGDFLLAISTSGTSPNILRAAEAARALGMYVIALIGKRDTPLASIATIPIITPGGKYADRVQELHIKVIHILIELVERQLFPELYPPKVLMNS